MGGRGASSRSGGGGGGEKMPELDGSEKQVAWANDIRDKAINAADNWEKYRSQQANATPQGKTESVKDALYYTQATKQSTKEAVSEFKSKTAEIKSAKTFIDRRNALSPKSVTKAIQDRALQIDKAKKRGRFK